MSSDSLQRPILLGVMGALAMMTLGVSIGLAMQLVGQRSLPTGLSAKIGLISGECARELEGIEREIKALKSELVSWRQEIANIEAEHLMELGKPIPVPEEIPKNQTEGGFRTVMDSLTTKTNTLALVDCTRYPCIAVFEDQKPGLTGRLRNGARKGGFSWSARWVSEATSASERGDRHYTALRFYPRKVALTIQQKRYLIVGLEDALDKAMNSKPNDKQR